MIIFYWYDNVGVHILGLVKSYYYHILSYVYLYQFDRSTRGDEFGGQKLFMGEWWGMNIHLTSYFRVVSQSFDS